MWKTLGSSLLLRVGIALSFLYAAIGGFLHPENWIGWFPAWVRELLPLGDHTLLGLFGSVEILIALWLLSGWNIRWSGLIAAFMLLGITVFNLGSFDIVFRDVALALASLELVFIKSPLNTPRVSTGDESGEGFNKPNT